MKSGLIVLLAVGLATGAVFMLTRHQGVLPLQKCEERILSNNPTQTLTCPSPSKLMRVEGTWICSCRSEEQTMKGISHP